MLQVAKIHEGCKINRSSVTFACRTTTAFGFYLPEVPSPQLVELAPLFVHCCSGVGTLHPLCDSDGHMVHRYLTWFFLHIRSELVLMIVASAKIVWTNDSNGWTSFAECRKLWKIVSFEERTVSCESNKRKMGLKNSTADGGAVCCSYKLPVKTEGP